MAFPVPADELALHERVLAGDPVATVDAYEAFMGPLVNALIRDLRCSEHDAQEHAIDALTAYLKKPEGYDPKRGRLSSYLMNIAKKRAVDRIRSETARRRREGAYASRAGWLGGSIRRRDRFVAVRGSASMEGWEIAVQARELWPKVEKAVTSDRDRMALTLILSGESSTEVLAEALGLADLPPDEQRRQVKQHRDRLFKVLERLGARLSRRQGQAGF